MSHLEGKDFPPAQEGTIQEPPPPPLPPLTLSFLHLPVDLWQHYAPEAWKGPGKEREKAGFFLRFYTFLLALLGLGRVEKLPGNGCGGTAIGMT